MKDYSNSIAQLCGLKAKYQNHLKIAFDTKNSADVAFYKAKLVSIKKALDAK